MMYGLCIVCIMLCIIYLTESPLMHLSTVIIGPALILTNHTTPHNTMHKYNTLKYNKSGTVAGGQESPKHLSNDLKPDIFDLKPRAGHVIKSNCDHLPPDVLDIFKNSRHVPVSHIDPLYINHLPDTQIKTQIKNQVNQMTFSRVISDDSPALMYQRTRGEFKRALHWGQLKLMLTEIEFLTLALQQYNLEYADQPDIQRPQFVMVYAGAAPGHHTQYLSELFPQVHFELYDPNKFAISDSEKIKIHIQFFTNTDAKYWAGRSVNLSQPGTHHTTHITPHTTMHQTMHTTTHTKHNAMHAKPLIYLVFCTDIRTEPATDDNVRENMNMQLEWWSIMNPNLSMFKFRLPWEAGKTQYPEGQIYIQPYPGPTSTETRLIAKRDAAIIDYDNEKYESQLFYHNNVIRKQSYVIAGQLLGLKKDPTISHNHVDSCYDCTAFIFIVSQYVALQYPNDTHTTQLEKIKSLINDIQLNITFGKHTIHTQTVRHINDALEKLRRSCYVECANAKCTVCKHQTDTLARQWKGESKATLQAYHLKNI